MGRHGTWLRIAIATCATALLTAAPALAGNDSMDTPTQLTFGVVEPTDTTAYGIRAGEPFTLNDPDATHTCKTDNSVGSGGEQVDRTAWFSFQGNGQAITLATDGSSIPVTLGNQDTVLIVYDHTLADTPVGCNDDLTPGSIYTSRFTSTFADGHDFLVQVGTACDHGSTCGSRNGGSIQLTATYPGAPANDNRAHAATLVPGTPIVASDVAASLEPGETSVCGEAVPKPYRTTLWYLFDATVAGRLVLNTYTIGSDDTVMAVYPATGTTPLACNDDRDASKGSRVALDIVPGHYFVQVGSYGTLTAGKGSFVLDAVLIPDADLDNDGVPGTPGPDCDDHDATIHPGAVDIPNDVIDQNCDGHPAADADHDGFLAPPDGGDCNDLDPAIHPAAKDVPGKGPAAELIDSNCDGRVAPDLRAPKVTIGGIPRKVTFARLAKGLTIKVALSEAASVSADLVAAATGAKLARAYPVRLAHGTRPSVSARTAAIRLHPSAKLLGHRARTLHVAVVVVATDAHGNRATKTRTITVRAH